jgi:serine/threonine protein kinase
VRIIVGIVLAMSYVHSQKVIHRDLTPENIMLDWKWNVRIADFGRSTSPDKPWISSISDDSGQVWPSGDSHYLPLNVMITSLLLIVMFSRLA